MIHPSHWHPDYRGAIDSCILLGYRDAKPEELPYPYNEVFGAETYMINGAGHIISISAIDAVVRDLE